MIHCFFVDDYFNTFFFEKKETNKTYIKFKSNKFNKYKIIFHFKILIHSFIKYDIYYRFLLIKIQLYIDI